MRLNRKIQSAIKKLIIRLITDSRDCSLVRLRGRRRKRKLKAHGKSKSVEIYKIK